jgi:hypothetical protein
MALSTEEIRKEVKEGKEGGRKEGLLNTIWKNG